MATTSGTLRVDYGLRLYHEVFKLDALHFGLWEPGEPLTVEALRGAQQRYTQRLIAMFPPGVHRVADVGCGTGATAVQLKAAGLDVECVNPDEYQGQVFRKLRGDGLPLHRVRFQDFRPSAPFDLVLMSESAQYVPSVDLFAAARRCLKPGGWLLVADYFRREPVAYYRTCHVLKDFLAAAEQAKFSLKKQVDITENVLPTLLLGRNVYNEYVVPLAEIMGGYIEQRAPFALKVVQLFLRKKLEKMRWYVYEKTPEKVDPEMFRKNVVYAFYLFKAPTA